MAGGSLGGLLGKGGGIPGCTEADPTCGQTHTCENINLRKLRLRAVIKEVIVPSSCFIFALLPPANEVWGKVMFSRVSSCPQVVYLWVQGRCAHPPPGQTPPDTHHGSRSGRYTSYWNEFLFTMKTILVGYRP